MSRFVFVFVAIVASLVGHAALGAAVSSKEKVPQYVLISFDGGLHLEQWARSRALARQSGARFTYFLSCVNLLSPQTRTAYRPHGRAPGRSNIGSGYSSKDVAERLSHVWDAHGEGHEIASHGCGHFNGETWSVSQWRHELQEFSRILADAWRINEIEGEPAGWRTFSQQRVAGFRAPYLATNAALYTALAEQGYSYDASAVSQQPETPAERNGLMRFALPMIAEGPARRRVIAMDYNLFVRHSKGKERPERASDFAARTQDAFMAAFTAEYEGTRRPLQIGFHFTLMNGGAYWMALERFVLEMCGKADVRCVTHRQYLAEQTPARQRNGNGY